MGDLKELCCDYLEGCITVANCLGICQFAEQFSCPLVLHKALCFLDDNFR
jgi:kelch-like protein 16 (gigaxonin)